MAVLSVAIQLMAFAVGAILYLVLVVAFLNKRRAGLQDWLLAVTLSCSALWFASRAVGLYESAVLDDPRFVPVFDSVGVLAGLLAAAFLVSVVTLWAELPRRVVILPVLAAVAVWWLWRGEPDLAYAAFVVLGISGAAAGAALVSRRRPDGRLGSTHLDQGPQPGHRPAHSRQDPRHRLVGRVDPRQRRITSQSRRVGSPHEGWE